MRTIRSTYVALALLVLLTLPAAAQESETVTRTFQLTLHGEAPENQKFDVIYFVDKGDDAQGVGFCGYPESGLQPCEGGGTVYTRTIEVPVSTTIRYAFARENRDDREDTESFSLGTETLRSDATNSASYTFGGETPDLPDTGAGAMSRNAIPFAPTTAALSVLAAGAFALRRPR